MVMMDIDRLKYLASRGDAEAIAQLDRVADRMRPSTVRLVAVDVAQSMLNACNIVCRRPPYATPATLHGAGFGYGYDNGNGGSTYFDRKSGNGERTYGDADGDGTGDGMTHCHLRENCMSYRY